jgi:hypothetical protein
MTDWRAVGAGCVLAGGYLLLLAILPWVSSVRLAGVPLVLGAGLLAGATAGLAADEGPHAGAWHGLLAGAVSGGVFAAVFVYVFAENVDGGVFHGLNDVVARSAADFPVVATHGSLVVGVLAGVGWASIAALGLFAGGRAPRRDSYRVIER